MQTCCQRAEKLQNSCCCWAGTVIPSSPHLPLRLMHCHLVHLTFAKMRRLSSLPLRGVTSSSSSSTSRLSALDAAMVWMRALNACVWISHICMVDQNNDFFWDQQQRSSRASQQNSSACACREMRGHSATASLPCMAGTQHAVATGVRPAMGAGMTNAGPSTIHYTRPGQTPLPAHQNPMCSSMVISPR